MKKTLHSRKASTRSRQASFLPELDFKPKLPPKNTLAFRALSLMLQGKKISHPDFQNQTCSWRLAAHIHILSNLGWPVETVSVPHAVSKEPMNRRIYQYFLHESVVDKFKEFSGGAL